LFLREYEGENFQLISEPTEIQLDNLKVLALPWICDGNSIETYELIRDTDASVCFGHLELGGFQMYKGSVQHEGMDPLIFDKFDMVMSGHYHHRSTNGNITYLGTPYEMIWSDYGDTKGFHILDTANRDLTFVASPYKLFHKVYYDDRDTTVDQLLDFDASVYTDCYVKIIIKAKTNPYWYDLFLEKLEEAVPIDVQPVEDNLNLNQESDEDILDEAEDTITILRKCVDSLETNEDKPALQLLLRNLYEEALSYSVSI
jgi:DNA repair exonuclease SbcCD nuclease subunit